ncbi:hypothetical protein GPECTOR_7g1082 [Gonium pectorale]|uniref:Nucleoplasmin-like domain-containing protein n=1 Tax=Gonium pectorale TaxID=33097 RepID=A0A150GV32_GONPE|nr:hypothetical protein GPECTOR_7g1082 [Gonium pectorale]|eukprot:KXZ53190.1 hypothetical protein GPECTOR_7g1082 [Gonium pectorale]
MAEAVAFWSVLVPPKGKPVEQEVESSQTMLTSIHVTGMALGASPSKGPHTVTVEYNGKNTVLGTLEAPHTRQYPFDVALDQTVRFKNSGDSEVHLYGFQVVTPVYQPDEDDEDEDEDEEIDSDFDVMGEEEEEDEDEDQKTPKAVPLGKAAKAKAKAAATPDSDGDMFMDDEADEDDGEDDEDEDEDEDGIPDMSQLDSDDIIGEADDGEDEDDEDEDEDEEESEEEEPPAKVGAKRTAQTPQPGKAAKQAKQAVPQSAPPKQTGAAKAGKEGPRQIPVKAVGADAEPKGKGKEEKGKDAKGKDAKGKETKGKELKAKEEKAKPAAPATPKGTAAPANEAEFKQALIDVIKSAKGGPVPLSTLGSAVKKPASVSGKLGHFLEQHKDVFAVDRVKGVTLKK